MEKEFKKGDMVLILQKSIFGGEDLTGYVCEVYRSTARTHSTLEIKVEGLPGVNAISYAFAESEVRLLKSKEEIQEALLKKARELYPIGTVYESVQGFKHTINTMDWKPSPVGKVYGPDGQGSLYLDGKWAKIIEKVDYSSKQELLEKAKRDYTIGVRFKSLESEGLIREVTPYSGHTGCTWYVGSDGVVRSDNGIGDGKGCSNPAIYKPNKGWAEIVYTPEKSQGSPKTIWDESIVGKKLRAIVNCPANTNHKKGDITVMKRLDGNTFTDEKWGFAYAAKDMSRYFELVEESVQKYKVGDKVKIIHKDGFPAHCFKIGDVVKIVTIGDEKNNFILRGVDCSQFVPMSDMEPFCETVETEKPNKEAFENCKIWIGDSEELSRKVQEKLFELGFVWATDTKSKYYHVNTSNGVCFLTSDKKITWGDIDSFQKKNHKQVSLEDLGIYDQTSCVAPETSVVPISKPVKKTVQTDVRVSSYTTVVLDLPKTQPKKIKQVVLLNNKTVTI